MTRHERMETKILWSVFERCDCGEIVCTVRMDNGMEFKVMSDPQDPTKPLLSCGTVKLHHCDGKDFDGACFVCEMLGAVRSS